ncbi:MAG: hypothetical protein K6F05_02020 [Succinivibrio sp.]|nr:hypothetical protein [Succinivibrio sp.]
MERKFLILLSIALGWFALLSCSANNAKTGNPVRVSANVYERDGMEISNLVSEMTDRLKRTMVYDLKRDQNAYFDHDVVFPKVAVTSFVDTDTYEDVSYLGRALAEMFVHELDRRGIPVHEYKITGNISVTKDGEIVFSRNWKKIAKTAMVQHVLAGTITRNSDGVVIVGRVIDMSSNAVRGSTTGFIPYARLPSCYRTGEKGCKFGAASGLTSTTITKTRAKNSKRDLSSQRSDGAAIINGTIYPAGSKTGTTSIGNYDIYQADAAKKTHNKGFGWRCNSKACLTPVIYPADTYVSNDKLVRDVHDQSQYVRIKDR